MYFELSNISFYKSYQLLFIWIFPHLCVFLNILSLFWLIKPRLSDLSLFLAFPKLKQFPSQRMLRTQAAMTQSNLCFTDQSFCLISNSKLKTDDYIPSNESEHGIWDYCQNTSKIAFWKRGKELNKSWVTNEEYETGGFFLSTTQKISHYIIQHHLW